MHIEICKELIDREFNNGWETNLDLSSPEKFKEKNPRFIGVLDTLLKNCFINLNLSVLKGEYILDKDFNLHLDKVSESLQFYLNINLTNGSIESEEEISGLLLDKLINPLNQSIKEYRGFYKEIINKYSVPFRISLLNAKRIERSLNDRTAQNYFHQFIDFNIELAKIDHNLAVKDIILQRLLIIYHEISEQKGNDYIQLILKNKCSYLLKKILIKFGRDPKKYYYAIDFEDQSLDPTKFDSGIFREFEDKTEQLQPDDGIMILSPELKDRIETLKNDFLSNKRYEKFEDYFLLVSELKQDKSSDVRIEKLRKSFNKWESDQVKWESDQVKFNQYVFAISQIYFYNNHVSYKLKHCELKISEIKRLFDSVKADQDELKIQNYFPYLKICNTLIEKFKRELEGEYFNSTELGKILDLLTSHLEKELFNAFEWCSDRNFLPFQQPFNECCLPKKNVNGKDEIENLFLASSFVLPINYQKVKIDIDDIKREISELKVKLELSKERVELEKIKTEIQKTDRRHIEILSVFAAIVIFASSSIQIYKGGFTLNDSLRFMLVFGYCLVLFIVIIWMITRSDGFKPNKLPLTHRIAISILFLSTIAAFSMIDISDKSSSNIQTVKSTKIVTPIVNDSIKRPSNDSITIK